MTTIITAIVRTGRGTTVKTRLGTTDWFKLGKGVHQGHMLSPCLFNFYGEGDDTPLQYSYLGNPLGGGAWWACSPWGH